MPGTPTAPPPLDPLIGAVEGAQALDGAGKAIAKRVRDTVGPGVVRDALAGTWLGHAIHPALTDVVVGTWLSASLLDVVGGDDGGAAAERLIAIGLAASGPTALTGTVDWADGEPADARVRRLGMVHAASNVVALGLYAASLAARRRGARGRGKALGLAGAAVLSASGWLGGHLTYARGVGVNQTAFDEGPSDWTDVLASADLEPRAPRAVVAGDTPVMLVRLGDGIHALHDRCSHRGCLLSDGDLDGELVTCACHGSQFDLRRGTLERGPATVPQPVYEVREANGRIAVRLPA